MNENGSHRGPIPEKLRLVAEGALIFSRQGRSSRDRYKVTSISGYSITPDLHSLDTDGKKWQTEWYVLDKFNAYEIVAVYGHKNAQKLARRLCYELNMEERQWEVEHGVR